MLGRVMAYENTVGCKIGLYPRSQVDAQSEDKGKVKVVNNVKRSIEYGFEVKASGSSDWQVSSMACGMIQFLNNIDKTLMVSIQEGPIKPYIDIPGTPETSDNTKIIHVLEALERKSMKKGEKAWKLDKLNSESIWRSRRFKFGAVNEKEGELCRYDTEFGSRSSVAVRSLIKPFS
ncbi:hypothetical protein OSB04_002417 [Centaurea solstitialis]|uniref:Uncharacterized protein n=1 Tax=Centaurea solstitialis TaxID=347529 RepID=A0AA38WVB5_9ASTR|nr:hypothetical protein OSB04_002417 [Centaurea solstitialis]